MMCDECGIRPAAFHLAIIENGEKREKNLCGVCMAEMKAYFPTIDFTGFAGLLSGLIEAANQMGDMPDGGDGLNCEYCGMDYEAFRKGGMLGCSHCYAAFSEPLQKILKRIHGHTRHAGRVPSGLSPEYIIDRSIDALRDQLKKAVASEAYEEAARIRDEIRALSKEKEQIANVLPSGEADT